MDSIPNGWPPPFCGPSCCTDQTTNVYVTGGLSNVLARFDYTPQLDAFGRLRVSEPYTLFDSQQRFDLDETFVSNVANGGTVTFVPTQSSANLQVTSTVGSFAGRETQYVFPYQPGKSLLIMATFVMADMSTGLRQRVGYFGADNGYFFEVADQAYMVERSNSTGTVTTFPVAQSVWNVDTLDGTGPSGLTLQKNRSQIFWVDLEWLGVGNVRTGFVINGQFVPVHIFQHANSARTAYMTTACLPVRYEIETVSSGPPATSNLIQICSTVISEGGYDPPYRLFSNIVSHNRPVTAGTWYPVFSIRLAPGRLESIVRLKQIDLIVEGSEIIHWSLWSNVTATNLTGASFRADPWSKNVQTDMSATAIDVTTCQRIANGIVSSSRQSASGDTLTLDKYLSQIGRNSFSQTSEIVTLAIYSVNAIGGPGLSTQAAVSWNELR